MTLTATMARRLRVASLAVLVAVGLVSAPAAMGRPALPSVRGLDRVLEANHPDRIPGSFIVKVAPGLDASRVARAISADYGGRITDTYSNVLGGFAIEGPDTLGGSLATDPRILLVEADRKVKTADLIVGKTTAGVRRTYSNRPGGSVDSARELTPPSDGSGVAGAIIDSGVDLQHQEFNSPGKFVDVDPSDPDIDTAYCAKGGLKVGPLVADANGHGTRTAGNFAAEGDASNGLEGVAPKAKIFAMRAKLTVSKVICAMNFVTAKNKDIYPSNNVRLVNMSLAWGDTNAYTEPCSANASHQAACDLVEGADGLLGTPDDVFVTVAAGNSNKDARHTAPGGYGQVFTVSAMCDRPTEGSPGVSDGLASFSNFGSVVDAIGPGCKVRSPEGRGTAYVTSSGTSRAAPHVLGIAALLLQDDPTMTAADLRTTLLGTAACADGTTAGPDLSCAGQGTWPRVRYSDYVVVGTDPDGITEPFPRAFHAVCQGDVPPAC